MHDSDCINEYSFVMLLQLENAGECEQSIFKIKTISKLYHPNHHHHDDHHYHSTNSNNARNQLNMQPS